MLSRMTEATAIHFFFFFLYWYTFFKRSVTLAAKKKISYRYTLSPIIDKKKKYSQQQKKENQNPYTDTETEKLANNIPHPTRYSKKRKRNQTDFCRDKNIRFFFSEALHWILLKNSSPISIVHFQTKKDKSKNKTHSHSIRKIAPTVEQNTLLIENKDNNK